MPQLTLRTSWLSLLVVVLVAMSTVNAHPIYQTDEEMEKGQAGTLESQSQRLIPDTKKYINALLQGLGLEEPTTTTTATPTPTTTATSTASVKTKQETADKNLTQTTHIIYSSSTSHTPTSSSNSAGYTHVVKDAYSKNKPIENIQIGPGWNGDRKVTPEDLPAVSDTLYRELENRLNNVIDSSDEIGLDSFL
ncbi:hypothetical protein PDIDSM_971 [Penicillium digitatum]|nr:hypothetical protein PDIDSM_971 [Penicillium digitatum]